MPRRRMFGDRPRIDAVERAMASHAARVDRALWRLAGEHAIPNRFGSSEVAAQCGLTQAQACAAGRRGGTRYIGGTDDDGTNIELAATYSRGWWSVASWPGSGGTGTTTT